MDRNEIWMHQIGVNETVYNAFLKMQDLSKKFLLVLDDKQNYFGFLGIREIQKLTIADAQKQVKEVCTRPGKSVSISNILFIQEARDIFEQFGMKYLPVLDCAGKVLDVLVKEHYLNREAEEQIGLQGDYEYDFASNHKYGKKITFIIPDPIPGSGGHRTFLRMIRSLAQKGHRVTVHVFPLGEGFTSGKQVEQCIRENFFDLESRIIYGTKQIASCDILIATFWETAYIVKENAHKAALCCYFIQEFEAYFYPMGYQYLRAYCTYKLGLYPITYGSKVEHLMKQEFQAQAGLFLRFSIDKKIYHPCNDFKKNKKAVIFLARPEMQRRCYPLGIEALRIVKERICDVVIYLYGAPKEAYRDLPFEVINCGILSAKELGYLYQRADVGLCFSTTNPSLVPYEMMSCGLPVIDLDFNGNEYNYGGRENVILSAPDAASIAENVVHLLEDDELYQRQVERGLAYMQDFLSDAECESLLEKTLLKELEKQA